MAENEYRSFEWQANEFAGRLLVPRAAPPSTEKERRRAEGLKVYYEVMDRVHGERMVAIPFYFGKVDRTIMVPLSRVEEFSDVEFNLETKLKAYEIWKRQQGR